jgi:hypothetical protein
MPKSNIEASKQNGMKQMMKLIAGCVTMLLPFVGTSQSTLQIGNRAFAGLSTNTYGIMNSWSGAAPAERGNRHAIIYPLQSIGIIPTGATITALRFYRDVLTGQAEGVLIGNPTFKLYAKNTALSTFATAVTWQDTANTMTTVFNGDPTTIVGTASGWVTFTLPTPIIYDGTNLMLLMEYWQTAAALPSIAWSYDVSSVSPQVTADYFNATQNRYNTPVTTLPFAANTTGSNIRHPTLQIVYTTNPIPVKLTAFEAAKRNSAVQLKWATSLETGTTVFEVQKSPDAANWAAIATVPALNLSNGASYQHQDHAPYSTGFYRLKITEDNARVYYSDVRKVTFAKNGSFVVTPSPATGFFRVGFQKATTAHLQLVSPAGIVVREARMYNQQAITIDVANLPAGIYLLRDLVGGATEKVLVQ